VVHARNYSVAFASADAGDYALANSDQTTQTVISAPTPRPLCKPIGCLQYTRGSAPTPESGHLMIDTSLYKTCTNALHSRGLRKAF
jgi:hypothetical protein